MKKLIVLCLIIILTASVITACNGANGQNGATAKDATENDGSSVVEQGTAAETTVEKAPADETNREDPTAESTGPRRIYSGKYTNPKYGWSIEIPSVWDSYGYINEMFGGDYLTFSYKESYSEKHGFGGHVFTICSTRDDFSEGNYASGGELYKGSELRVYWYKATDVQFLYATDENDDLYVLENDDPQFEKRQTEYRALSDTREGILDSFSF